MNIQVPGEGSKKAKIVIIGEAPGAEEARLRRPFSGTGGKELDNALGAAGLVRASCYLTHVVKERPTSYDVSKFCWWTKKGIMMSPEYHEYEAALYEEIDALDPTIIIPLGNVALWAVAREWGIGKWRGSVIPSIERLGGVKIMPTYPPASSIKNFIWRYFIARDFKRAGYQSGFKEIKQKKRTYITSPLYAESVDLLNQVAKLPKTACDIEVVNYELACIGFSLAPDIAFCIPFHSLNTGEDCFSEMQEETLMLMVEEILGNDSIIKVWQNGIFDTSFLYEKYGIVSRNNRDTLIATGLLHPDFPRSLAFQCSMFTDMPYYKEEGKDPDGARLAHGKDKMFWEYNCKDVCATAELDEFYEPKLKESGNWETYLLHCECMNPCCYMQAHGVRFDWESAKASVGEIELEIEAHYKELDELMDRPVPRTFASSPKQKVEYFYGELGIKPYKDKGKISCNAVALKKIARRRKPNGDRMKGCKEAVIVSEITTKVKLKGSYFDVNLDEDKRLRGSWNPLGTETGRFSCQQVWRG